MRILGAMVAITVGGCGGGGGGSTDAPIDGNGPPDAPPPDARLDAAPPDPGEYVIDRIHVPTSSSEVQTYGQDLDGDQPDGDAGVDNQFGSTLAALSSLGIDVQLAVDVAVDRGASITLAYLDPDDGSLDTYGGNHPNPPACSGPTDTVCRHHLDGSGGFDLVVGGPLGSMPTTTVATTTTGGPGDAVLQLALAGPTVATLHLFGARFTGTVDAAGITNGRLAGVIAADAIDNDLIPAIAGSMTAVIAADCPTPTPPDCNCTPGSTGETFQSTFDANDDCTITAAELHDDPLVSGFLMPDVQIGGTVGLSLGVGVTAVPGSFTPL